MSVHPSNEWGDVLADLDRRRERALQMGGADNLKRARDRGMLDARERVHRLVDPGSLREFGMLAGKGSYGPQGEFEGFTHELRCIGRDGPPSRKLPALAMASITRLGPTVQQMRKPG